MALATLALSSAQTWPKAARHSLHPHEDRERQRDRQIRSDQIRSDRWIHTYRPVLASLQTLMVLAPDTALFAPCRQCRLEASASKMFFSTWFTTRWQSLSGTWAFPTTQLAFSHVTLRSRGAALILPGRRDQNFDPESFHALTENSLAVRRSSGQRRATFSTLVSRSCPGVC